MFLPVKLALTMALALVQFVVWLLWTLPWKVTATLVALGLVVWFTSSEGEPSSRRASPPALTRASTAPSRPKSTRPRSSRSRGATGSRQLVAEAACRVPPGSAGSRCSLPGGVVPRGAAAGGGQATVSPRASGPTDPEEKALGQGEP